MNINITLLGQAFTFILLVWFTMKFVWPPVVAAMHEREKKIADGIAAGEKGREELQHAEIKVAEQLQAAKAKSAEILEHANKRAHQLIDASKEDAREAGRRLIDAAEADILQSTNQARERLRRDVAGLAVCVAEKLLEHTIDENKHNELLDKLAEKL